MSVFSCSEVNELNEQPDDNNHVLTFSAHKHPNPGICCSHLSQRFGISGGVIVIKVY